MKKTFKISFLCLSTFFGLIGCSGDDPLNMNNSMSKQNLLPGGVLLQKIEYSSTEYLEKSTTTYEYDDQNRVNKLTENY